MGADGSYMPPLFIFPRKRMKDELMTNGPRGSWAMCHESGWIQKDIFTEWFKKFIQFSRASRDNPVLLLLDGNASHVKNLDIVDLGREHGVHILSFPPHCTHRLQPLDVGFMKPLSTYYTEPANRWLKMNGGKVITQFQIAGLVNQAFQKTATLTTAYNAYEHTGIWPLNRDRFTESDFLAAATTNIDANDSDTDDERLMISQPQSYTSRVAQPSATVPQEATTSHPQLSTSRAAQPFATVPQEATTSYPQLSTSQIAQPQPSTSRAAHQSATVPHEATTSQPQPSISPDSQPSATVPQEATTSHLHH